MTEELRGLRNHWPIPAAPQPVVIIGAGGIVNDAHLPAYRKAAFPVAGIYDIDASRARAIADQFDIANVYPTLAEAAEHRDVIFDVAVPPEYEFDVVGALPDGAAVLLQKPLGVNLADARRIRDLCQSQATEGCRQLSASFQPDDAGDWRSDRPRAAGRHRGR